MNRRIAFTVLVLFPLFGSLTFARGQIPTEDEAREIVRDLNARWAAAFKERNAERLAELFVRHGVRQPNGLPTASGRIELKRQYQAELESIGDVEIEATVLVEEILVAGNLIVARGQSTTQLNSRDSPEPKVAKGKWIAVLEQDSEGKWKYRWSTFNETRE